MRWSKLRQRVEESFAESVRGRVTVHSTRYGCSCGRGWIAVDGKEIVDMNTILAWPYYGWQGKFDDDGHSIVSPEERHANCLAELGEFTRFQLHEACWEFVHSNAHACLASSDPLVKSLAALSAKVGVRPLRAMRDAELHPLTRALLEFRLTAEAESKAARSA